jgi:ribosome-associated heat shock protein Hsp15
VKGGDATADISGRRLDQWLWFARFFKSRSIAARQCTGGRVTVNGVNITKANHLVRMGDRISVPHGTIRRTVRLLQLGARRGPAAEARLLYEEIDTPVRLSACAPAWVPLIMSENEADYEN